MPINASNLDGFYGISFRHKLVGVRQGQVFSMWKKELQWNASIPYRRDDSDSSNVQVLWICSTLCHANLRRVSSRSGRRGPESANSLQQVAFWWDKMPEEALTARAWRTWWTFHMFMLALKAEAPQGILYIYHRRCKSIPTMLPF